MEKEKEENPKKTLHLKSYIVNLKSMNSLPVIFTLLIIFQSCSNKGMKTEDPVSQSTTEETNANLVRYFFEEVYNKGNFAVADSLIAEKYTSHNKLNIEVIGPDGIKQAAAAQRSAFSNWKTVLDDVVAQGDKVVVRGHDEGNFTSDYMGIEATGNHFYITWIDIFRIENGKLAEAWLEIDTQDFRKQLTGK